MKTKTFFITSLLMLLLQTNIFAQDGKIIYTDFNDSLTLLIKGAYWDPNVITSIAIDFDIDGQTDCFVYWSSQVGILTTGVHYKGEEWRITRVDSVSYYGDEYFCRNAIELEMSSYECWRWSVWDKWNLWGENPCKIGVRKHIKEDDYCYGWLRYSNIEKDGEKYIVVHDMAFCTIPNYPLKFGQMYLEGIEENEAGSKVFTVYPNPASEFITIENNGNQEICEVALYNANGQLLGSWNGDENIDIRNFQNGMYILKINTNDNNSFFKKIVIAK